MTVKQVFGWFLIAFFLLACFFSIVLHNQWHAVAIFAIGALGLYLRKK